MHHRVPEDQSGALSRPDAVRECAVIAEEVGLATCEIVVEIDQKSELTLLVVIARKGAVEVQVERLPDIVAIEAKSLVERQQLPAEPVSRKQVFGAFKEARGERLIVEDQTRVIAHFGTENRRAMCAHNGRFFVAAVLALRDELLALLRAQEVVDGEEFVADERSFVHKIGQQATRESV